MKANRYFRRKKSDILKKVLAYVVLIFACLAVLLPLTIVVSTSLKTDSDANTFPFKFIPEVFSADAYIEVLTNSRVWLGLINTLIIVLPVMFVGVFVSSLAAFAFAKLEFKGKNIIFSLLLGSMMLPGVITMTPAYVLYDAIGWTDSWLPLMVPGLFGTASCIFFMRNYLVKVPNALIDAGKMAGLSMFGIFRKIVLPIIKPALVAQIILWFFAGYNDYFGPMLYLSTESNFNLQLVLKNMVAQYETSPTVMMANCVFALIPALVIYGFAQKSLIRGISLQGVKK
jgi:multiple sugar transport system permease protein